MSTAALWWIKSEIQFGWRELDGRSGLSRGRPNLAYCSKQRRELCFSIVRGNSGHNSHCLEYGADARPDRCRWRWYCLEEPGARLNDAEYGDFRPGPLLPWC